MFDNLVASDDSTNVQIVGLIIGEVVVVDGAER